MPGTWWTRFTIVAAVTLWAIWSLIPTLLGKSVQDKLAAEAEAATSAAAGETTDDSAEELDWWMKLLPKYRLALGLDLQGGIDLTLNVGTDEAVLGTVQRTVKPLHDAATKDGLQLTSVTRERGQPTILIELGPTTHIDDLRKFMDKRYGDYEYKSTKSVEENGVTKDVHVFTLSDAAQASIKKNAIQQALQTLRDRINETGVKEPVIVLKGGNRITVQLPGMDNVEAAVKAIGTTAVLEFRLLDPDVDPAAIDRALLEAEKTLTPEEYADDTALSNWMIDTGRIPKNDRLMFEYKEAPAGQQGTKKGRVRAEPIVVHDEVVLTGDDINNASVSMNQFNQPYTALEFKPRGGQIFEDITAQNVGRRFAIILDGEVRSAPVIRERIGGGRASIEMGTQDYQSAMADASLLSLVLRTGALPAPVTVAETRVVGPSLGADSIRDGIIGTLGGAIFVVLFMLVVYRLSGVIANIALAVNVLLVLALLAAAGATLTLPGITGIALTIGMAVDCNIIFYERIKDERKLGKAPRAAIDAGFANALSAVVDAHITTTIAGIVLYTYGTGPIRGFAVTLLIGVIVNLFTGVFMSQMMMEYLGRKSGDRLSI
jgi:protein-export membrane protein SecD